MSFSRVRIPPLAQRLVQDINAKTGRRWCRLCQRSVEVKFYKKHLTNSTHLAAASKEAKLAQLSNALWEEHRGAPTDEPSAHEQAIRRELMAHEAAVRSMQKRQQAPTAQQPTSRPFQAFPPR